MTPLYWIDGPWPGRLAIAPRPRGGDWLADEIREWRQMGVDGIVSTLTPSEIAELDLAEEERWSASQPGWYVNLPIPDRGVPASKASALALLKDCSARLRKGETIAIHCRQGIGRSAMLAAALLGMNGVDLREAWERIATSRGTAVPDTSEQKAWVELLANEAESRAAHDSPATVAVGSPLDGRLNV